MYLVFVSKDEVMEYDRRTSVKQPKQKLQNMVLEFANSGKQCALVVGYNENRPVGSICTSIRTCAKDMGFPHIFCRVRGKTIYMENSLIGG